MSRPPRVSPGAYTGGWLVFLTICTARRQRFFLDNDAVALVTLHFLQTAAAEGVEILVYCFMPDHLHLLVRAASIGSDIRRYVSLSKQKAGYAFARRSGNALWQASYYDRILRDDELPNTVIGYIVNNPIRAGLVERPDEYPFWGSGIWSRDDVLDFIANAERRS